MCYVDIKADTDVEEVFNYYRDSINKLKRDFLGVKFVHFTVPLMVQKENWKTKIKKLIGKKDIWELEDNIKRNEFNDFLLKEYQGKDPIFDLAKIESTYPDGKRQGFSFGDKTYYSLIGLYSNDGGHLNEKGQIWVASHMLSFLARLLK